MMTGLRFLIARLREHSTWNGLTALATAFGIYLDPEQLEAIIVAGVAFAGALNVFWPDAAAPPVPPVVPLLLLACLVSPALVACVHYDGARYQTLASIGAVSDRLGPDSCAAHVGGADALGAGAGESTALKVPFGRGYAIESLAQEHRWQARVCGELVARDVEGALDPASRAVSLEAWRSMWHDGAAIAGGGLP
jgi:hypothetical protein